MPGDPHRLPVIIGFNPRPAVRPGDAAHVFSRLTFCEFQSAPGREAGRCVMLNQTMSMGKCFNPRPAVRPGDASLVGCSNTRRKRFNPRPAVRPGDAIFERGEYAA